MDESSFVKTPLGVQIQRIKEPIEEVVMTAVRNFSQRDPAQSDLIRYFDRDLVAVEATPIIDRFAIEARARRDRAALMGEMIGEGLAWLRRRTTRFGETRSPAPRLYVEGRVQF
jgi:hypothetical protein